MDRYIAVHRRHGWTVFDRVQLETLCHYEREEDAVDRARVMNSENSDWADELAALDNVADGSMVTADLPDNLPPF